MSDLNPERLAELRRIAEAATRCPECGVVWSLGRDVGGRVHTPGGIDCLHRQLTAARAEAERWQARYEALRAGVERVVQHLYERTRATARDWRQSGHPYHDGASDAYCEAFLKVRRVLPERGR